MNLKLTKEQLIELIIDSIKELDDLSLDLDYNSFLERTKSIESYIRALDSEGCIQLFNKLKEMIKKQEETTGYATPAIGAYYEYMFYRVPNIEVRERTRTHNK